MSDARAKAVTLYVDAVCPFSYMVATAVAATADGMAAVVRWYAVPLAGCGHGASTADAAMHAARCDAAWPAVVELARSFGLALRRRPPWLVDSRPFATLCARLGDAPPIVLERLFLGAFDAYFGDGADIGDPRVLASVARAAGVDGTLARVTDLEATAAAEAAVAAAAARRITAVPALVVDEHLIMGAQPLQVIRGLLAHPTPRGPGADGAVSLEGPTLPSPEVR